MSSDRNKSVYAFQKNLQLVHPLNISSSTKRRKDLDRVNNKDIVGLNIILTTSDETVRNSTSSQNVVQGVLEIEARADNIIHGILVTIHGKIWSEITSCPMTEGDPRYSASIFVESTYILGRGSGTIVLKRGKQRLPFTFRLPRHLPSSFEGEYGSILYQITAQVHSDNERIDEMNQTSHPVHVRRYLDLSEGEAYGNAICIPSSIERPLKTLRTALVPIHNLKFNFKIQKTGFAVGEIIPFVLDVYNPERKKLSSMAVILVKKTVYGDLKNNIDVFSEVADVRASTIDSHKSNLTWIGSLHVPTEVIPTHSVIASVPKKKPIFSHRYLLRAKVYPEAGTCLLGDLPVIIGTSKFECRIRRQNDHCSRAVVTPSSRGLHENPETRRRQSSLPPSYSQSWSTPERRTSLETLPPPYEEALAMASRTLAKETKHLMG